MSRLRTKRQINYILRQIGSGGPGGIKVSAHTFSHALELTAGVPAHLSGQFLAELRRQHLVEFTRSEDSIQLQLSVKGIHRLQLSEIHDLAITAPDTWDGYWRIVLFDLPSHYTHQRYLLTSQLKRLGFVMMHDSTWYHPYPCHEAVTRLISYCSISRYVTTGEITNLDPATSRKLLLRFPQLTALEK